MSVSLGVENKRLCVGVGFVTEWQPPYPDPVNSLGEILQKEGYKTELPWWVGWKWIGDGTNDYMTDTSFLVEMASAPTLIAGKATEAVLILLRDRTRRC
jgi:hypothetical protein